MAYKGAFCLSLFAVPLQSWGSAFNFTIWYIALHGDDGQAEVQRAVSLLYKVSYVYFIV